jgi:hypothetical protein
MSAQNGDGSEMGEVAATEAALQGLSPDPQEEKQDTSELIEQLTDSDLVAADGTLKNLATKDIPSANFSEEEAEEFRHYLDVVLERKRAAYPHEGQLMTGILREWAHDDPDAGLEPVDKHDLLADETYKQGVAARITKGKRGSLIGLALRSIRESVVRRGGNDDKGSGILGKLKR